MRRVWPASIRAASSTRAALRSEGAGGFTLVELLVALMLAAILSLSIMTISSSASNTYVATVERVSVYANFRLAMKTMQNDFASWIPTQELEFYIDGKGNSSRRDFHYTPGEEEPDRRDENGPFVVNGGTPDYDEYAYIWERHYSSVETLQIDDGDTDPKLHDAYQAYFRTMTYVDGSVREANVEYMLVDPSRPKSEWKGGVPPAPVKVDAKNVPGLALYKIIRYFRIDRDTITNLNKYPIVRRIVEVATNVTDFRVEYLTSNPFSRRRSTGALKFRSPGEDYAAPAERAVRPEAVRGAGPGKSYRKSFGYGSVKIDTQIDLAVAQTAVWGDDNLRGGGRAPQPVRVGFTGNSRISFAELVPGDKLYIFTDSERGARRNSQNVTGRLAAFPAGDYTVKTNRNGMLEVFEDIDSSTWGESGVQGVRYKAAFMPAALRVTIRMVDDDGKNPKTMQQVIWLRRRAQ